MSSLVVSNTTQLSDGGSSSRTTTDMTSLQEAGLFSVPSRADRGAVEGGSHAPPGHATPCDGLEEDGGVMRGHGVVCVCVCVFGS